MYKINYHIYGGQVLSIVIRIFIFMIASCAAAALPDSALINSNYLNITLDSSESIYLTLESVPEMVTMRIESASGATSAQIKLGGFAPLTTYHKYEDDYHNHLAFTTDNSGNYTYIQDISSPHLVFIQPRPSTKFIRDDATGGDCAPTLNPIGTWNGATKTCTLTTDLSETIQIDNNGITLNGNGHTTTGSNTGYGVYLHGKNGVTIKNLNVRDFIRGIYLYSSSNNMLSGNNANSNKYGIHLYLSNNNRLNGNNANSNNDLMDTTGSGGIRLESSNDNTLIGNNANNNIAGILTYDPRISWGIDLSGSDNNTLIGNNAYENWYGIALYGSDNNTLIGNNASSRLSREAFLMYSKGIILESSNNNTLSGNNASNNWYGIRLSSSNNNMLAGNNASLNDYYGIYMFSSSNNKIYNNIFNNTINFYFRTSNINTWNTTRQSGPNIIGGPILGGNFWADPQDTGFSQTCPDVNKDGICDMPYVLDGNNTDYLPLSTKFRIKGDVDGDSLITASDALLYLRYAVGQNIAPYHMDESDDVTCDGNIFADDALLVLRKAVNQPVDLTCPKP